MNHGYGARHSGRAGGGYLNHGGHGGHGHGHGPHGIHHGGHGGGHHGGGMQHGAFPARRQFGAARGRRPRPADLSWSSPGPPLGPPGPAAHLGPGGGPPGGLSGGGGPMGPREGFCGGGGGARYDQTPARYRRHSSGGGPGKLAGAGSWGSHNSHSSSSSHGAEEPTSSESEVAADGSSGSDPAELSQAIPRIIKPRKRRKKEKKPKIPRMAAAAEERSAASPSSCSSSGGRWERRPSSLGTDTHSSSESALSAFGSEWYLPGEQLDALCAELTVLRLRRQLTPPELTLTPPDSPGAAQAVGWRQLGGLRRSRSEPTHRALPDDRRSFSCPSSLEFREATPGEWCPRLGPGDAGSCPGSDRRLQAV